MPFDGFADRDANNNVALIGAPISLYFDVQKGKHANLEVVAKSALEWVELIRDIASVVSPSLDFDVELVRTEDGSIWLSNILKSVKTGDRKALASVAYAVVFFFILGPALHLQTDFGDKFWEILGHEHDIEVTDLLKDEISKQVEKAIEQTDAESRRRNIVLEAEKDESINGIGVDFSPRREGPICKITRDDYPFYAPPIERKRDVPIKDTEIRQNVRVKIERANLAEDETNPRWRFKEGETKWSADIQDDEFVVALNLEQTGLPLAFGQTMVVDVAIDRKFVDGAWEEINRRIIRVIEPRVNRRQAGLDLGSE